MILGKRHIVLAALVLALGIAVYLNWSFSAQDGGFAVSGALEEGRNYGDAEFVEAPEEGGEVEAGASGAFFSEARVTRQKTRDEAVETLTQMFQDASLSDEQKAELAVQANAVAQAIETEGKIESMLRAKGFSDCLVYIDGGRVDAVIKTGGLLKEEVAQIKDILIAETGAGADDISITEAK
ncbi:MAG: SpoIIIAH-like family protein [Oscillospiraceae bacterium]|nr:SpoIIIAH-like family protein [Oscillospiraceae bacterium]